MSLNKSIKYGKDKRQPYRNSKAFDATCRNHGSCLWCKENRLYKFRDKYYKETDDEFEDE